MVHHIWYTIYGIPYILCSKHVKKYFEKSNKINSPWDLAGWIGIEICYQNVKVSSKTALYSASYDQKRCIVYYTVLYYIILIYTILMGPPIPKRHLKGTWAHIPQRHLKGTWAPWAHRALKALKGTWAPWAHRALKDLKGTWAHGPHGPIGP